jgi:signal recognition particle subunit SRP54
MFETISDNLDSIFRKLRLRGRLTEGTVADAMREIRRALLEADVNYRVAKEFIDSVSKEALGEKVIKAISPAQLIVKIVNDKLVELMGPVDHKIPQNDKGPTVIMLAGLQGSGKTTTCAKLAKYLQRKGHQPLMVAADVRRPAAIEQLQVLGKDIGIGVYTETGANPPQICRNAVNYADETNCDFVLLDTAGRLHIDVEMMEELKEIARKIKPEQMYLVCDAMTGQDAVNSAKEFNEQLELDGVILTKLDGDARGGAALSVKAVTGKPIKFVGVGERLDKLEEFYPDRMASRILGMGDVVTLVEKAQDAFDEEQAKKLEEKLLKKQFNLEDFLSQLEQMKKMGPLSEMLSMIPGLGKRLKGMEVDDSQLGTIEAVIRSMTVKERRNPDVIDASRRQRIARGSGTSVGDVGALLKQFKQMKHMMKRFGDGLSPAAVGAGGMPFAMPSGRPGKKRSKRKKKKRKR